ncbi:MAG: hypothetical protein RLZZ230_211 [Candidatus Parcubacteria bacterium]|jgi:hypothetical protein
MNKVVILSLIILAATTNTAWATATEYDQTCLKELEGDESLIIADSVIFSNGTITMIFPDGKRIEANHNLINSKHNELIETELSKGFTPIATVEAATKEEIASGKEIPSNQKTPSLTVPSAWGENKNTVSCSSFILQK